MQLTIPELALVVLVGASGSGKSTFARTHFKPTEVLSSDFCRGLVADDENDQSATGDAFDVLHYVARKRLAAGRLTVVDATNVQADARKPLVAMAREYHCLPVAIVFDLPERLCHDRNAQRSDRDFGPHVVRRQSRELHRSLGNLQREGFRYVYVLKSPEQVAAATIERQPLWTNRKHDHGPFDVIGDVHGCYDELVALLEHLGYEPAPPAPDGDGTAGDSPTQHSALSTQHWTHPDGRKVVFLGDLVDRGPRIPDVLRLAMGMVEAVSALCLLGNHENKLLRKLRGRTVQITHGLAETLAQFDQEPPEFRERVAAFLDSLVVHYVLDDGKLVVAHAGMPAEMQGRASARQREFGLYGETTGETDEFGLPVRYNWAADYRAPALVVYGHTPVADPEWLNGTINVDTGCVFGGRLTALRYPEKVLASVPAVRTYYEPARPFLPEGEQAPALTAQQQHDEVLDVAGVMGKRIVGTRLAGSVTIREENALAALEVMTRFAANPKWLIYLPPTMSPTGTSREPGLLEHPAEAFAYYRGQGVPRVVCEEKHMGSRAVVIVCRDETVARQRFGIVDEGHGICYTRTGRRFFDDAALEKEFLARVRAALDAADLWAELKTDWVCLDCELMPWSAKAQELLRRQYAAVGAAGRAALAEAVATLEQAQASTPAEPTDVPALLAHYRTRSQSLADYVESYRRYCWPVNSLADLRLAPFHLLASEGAFHTARDHTWHLDILGRLCAADRSPDSGGSSTEPATSLLVPTPHRVVDVTDPASEQAAVDWWVALTETGGEGMVVKPLDFTVRGPRGLVQPGVKCRGREYLRIIYGPEYTAPEHLERLRKRGVAAKQALALREYALGVEALERFVRREPLHRVHECVFGVLALESTPVDPRL